MCFDIKDTMKAYFCCRHRLFRLYILEQVILSILNLHQRVVLMDVFNGLSLIELKNKRKEVNRLLSKGMFLIQLKK